MKIDAHQHFWKYDPVEFAWITDDMELLKRDFLPEELWSVLKENDMDGCIAVQASQTPLETKFLLELGAQFDFIKGVVGWVDLKAPNIEQILDAYSNSEKLKGFRHVVQAEPDPNFLLNGNFRKGLHAIFQRGYTYDILVYPHQLGAVLELIRLFPDQPFVIDHLAKPYVKAGYFDGWAVLMEAIAEYDHVFCKVSGMVTEGDWQHWRYGDFLPYLDHVFRVFGEDRLLFGSDWPVCLLGGSYGEVASIVKQYIEENAATAFDAIMGGNAVKFYQV